MSQGRSAHGTKLYRNHTLIGELKNITPPALTRKEIERTTQNDDDDSYIVGIRRHGDLTMDINFLPEVDATHGTLTGLVHAWNTGSNDGYLLVFTDGSRWNWSGFVTNIAPKAPVDDIFEAAISIRPGNGIVIR